MSSAFSNPFWTDVQNLIKDHVLITDPNGLLQAAPSNASVLSALIARYSPAIADPKVVNAVAGFAVTGTVEADAKNAYWTYLMAQTGRTSIAFDTSGEPLQEWATIHRLDVRRHLIADHPGLALLTVGGKPPLAARALRSYRGQRFIYLGKDPHRDRYLSGLLADWKLMNTVRGLHTASFPFAAHMFARGDAAVTRVVAAARLPTWALDTAPAGVPVLYGYGRPTDD